MNITTYLSERILDHTLRGTAYIPGDAVYAGLLRDISSNGLEYTEVDGGNYQRVAVLFGSAALGSSNNNVDVVWPAADSEWGRVTNIGLFNSATGGNLLWWGDLAVARFISFSGVFKIPAESLVVTLSGALSDEMRNLLLNLILNKVFFDPPQIYIGLLDTNSTELNDEYGYARQKVLNSDFTVMGDGITTLEVPLMFRAIGGSWGEVGYAGIFDSGVDGTLLYTIPLTTTAIVDDGDGIDIGEIQMAIASQYEEGYAAGYAAGIADCPPGCTAADLAAAEAVGVKAVADIVPASVNKTVPATISSEKYQFGIDAVDAEASAPLGAGNTAVNVAGNLNDIGEATGIAAAHAALTAVDTSGSFGMNTPPFSTWFSGDMGIYHWCFVPANPTLIFTNADPGVSAASGALEPAWDTTPGNPTVDNEITWTANLITDFTETVDLKPNINDIGVPQLYLDALAVDMVAAQSWHYYITLNDNTIIDMGLISANYTPDGANYFSNGNTSSWGGTAIAKWAKSATLQLDTSQMAVNSPFGGWSGNANLTSAAIRKGV